MGYDMTIVGDMTDAEKQAATLARKDVDEAVAERDRLPRDTPEWEQAHLHVQDAFDKLDAANVTYHRLNIWGMQKCRELMNEFGMLKAPIVGEFPHIPDDFDRGDYWEWAEKLEDGDVVPLNPEYDAFYRSVQEHLSAHSGDTPGIAWNKFSSNDGWLVTPGEALSIPGLWKKVNPLRQAEVLDEYPWFADWVLFNARAAQRGGYKVY